MASYVFPITGVLIIAVAIFFAVKNRNDTGKCISSVLVGIFFSTFFMVLPTEWVKEGKEVLSHWGYSALSSLLYSFKALGGRQDIAQLETVALSGVLKHIYIWINYISFVLAPVLTSSLILSFFGDTGEKMRYALKFSSKCYCFSELNENSLALAKGINQNQKSKTVVFCNTKKSDKKLITEAKQLGAVTLHKPCEALRLSRRFKSYEFCLLSHDEDDNIKTAEALITKNRSLHKTSLTVNAFAESGTNINVLENLMQKQPCFVFGELSESALKKATELIESKQNARILFCGTANADRTLLTEAFEQGFVLNKHPWQKVRPYPEFESCCFTLYKQSEENKFSTTELKVFKNRFTTDWADDPVKLRFIDEIAFFCNDLIFEHPLYDLPSCRKDISVMIVGCGRLGMRMLKTVSWCGLIDGYSLKIRVYDKDACKAKKEFYKQCPELTDRDIEFINADVESADFKDKMSDSLDATYVTVATGNDELNLSCAEYLYRVFRRHGGFDYTPPIFTRVRKNIKSSNFAGNNSYLSERNIHLFGTAESIFTDNTLFNTRLENLSFAVHLCYWGALYEDKNSFYYNTVLENFQTSEYSRRSSMASALHIPAKLRSCGVLGPKDTYPTKDHIEKYKELLKDDELVKKLTINEHDRWNAFMQSEGYEGADINTVALYAEKNGSHKDERSKTHPCITDWDTLGIIEQQYNDLDFPKKKVDFKIYDEKIVKEIPRMIEIAQERCKEK